MLKDCFESYYFDGNYNCAEALLRAANDYYSLGMHDSDMIAFGGYGAGIQTGNTCGAILATVAVLSKRYIKVKAHESEDIKPVTTALINEFTKRYGSLLCKDIKPQSFDPQFRCRNTVSTACSVLEQIISDYDSGNI